MNYISEKKDGYILINGQPYQVGSLRITFNNPDVRITPIVNEIQILLKTRYDDIANRDTGVTFPSFESLRVFLLANCYWNQEGVKEPEEPGEQENQYTQYDLSFNLG